MKENDILQTPQYILDALGKFDLDPCAGASTNCAETNYRLPQDGLSLPWAGLVYCNPPFSQKQIWIEKMISHNNGILLLPERGSAPWFGPVAMAAGSYFVMGKKINFIGGPSSNNLGSVLFPFGEEAKFRIHNSDLCGHFVDVKYFKARQ